MHSAHNRDYLGSSPRRPTKLLCGRGGMADAYDLGSYVFWRAGSSPVARTKSRLNLSRKSGLHEPLYLPPKIHGNLPYIIIYSRLAQSVERLGVNQ